MSDAAAPDAASADAELAINLLALDAAAFGGIVLSGDGDARDAAVALLSEAIGTRGRVVRLPVSVDAERLAGGIDLTASLAAGRAVPRAGLIDLAAGGALVVPMAERMPGATAALLARAMDERSLAVLLLDDGRDDEEQPPAVLLERVAFRCDLTGMAKAAVEPLWRTALPLADVQALSIAQLERIAATSSAFGVSSGRALLFADRAARAIAALHRRTQPSDEDVLAALRLTVAPRATQIPQPSPPPPDPAPESAPPPDPGDAGDRDEPPPLPDPAQLEEMLLAAVAASVPPDVLSRIGDGARAGGKGQMGKSGQKQASALRGRPMSARPGVPGHGRRLALIETLRAAAPWQRIRRRESVADGAGRIHIRKSDLRVRRFEQRRESLVIFTVDASGSSALARLAEAKGAVELMLADAYVRRARVALIAFRASGAELLLPPTRSLTRARRALTALPGGGGTPLAAGLIAAMQLAEGSARSGLSPVIALLTDGKGNMTLDGGADRVGAMEQALVAARQLAALAIPGIVIDISPRPRAEAAELAEALRARYLPLPAARSAAMVEAIDSLARA